VSPLKRAAFANIVVHALGLAAAALLLKPGTPLVPQAHRLAWLAGRPWQWMAGWAIWILCALAMGIFATLLGRAARPREPGLARTLIKLAVIAAWIGATLDVVCDVAWMTLPGLAARAHAADAPDWALEAFLGVERNLGAAGQIGANGLYSLSVLLLSLAIPARPVRLLGAATFVAGMGIVAAGVADSPRLLMLSTGPTIGLFCVWTAAAAMAVERERRA
jgi:hypothetical protein